MYAIIKTGGKQYHVKKGDIIKVELLGIEKDKEVEFKEIVLLGDGQQIKVGTPHIKGSVIGKVLDEVKEKKVLVYKYKRRKNYRRKKGHRQRLNRVKITDIKT